MVLFISHSGSDTESARALKRRILDTETAQKSGARVWLDVDDLDAGRAWQPQLEEALQAATAFCVYLGTNGVVNWVDREVREGVDRATGPDPIPFIPIRASDAVDWNALPPFARQFHGITDPLGNADALVALIEAATGRAETAVILTDTPFVGLHAMGEDEADRFFGRDEEISELVGLVRANPISAVVADSGAGKSSLVRAGLVPAFRGGALADADRPAPDRARHFVVMRPGSDPVQGLKDGIDRAAELEQSVEESLEVSLPVVMLCVLMNGPAEVAFTERDHRPQPILS